MISDDNLPDPVARTRTRPALSRRPVPATQAAHAAAEDGTAVPGVDLAILAGALKRGALPSVLAALLVTGLAAAVLAWIPLSYRSEATVLVRTRPANLAIEGLSPPSPATDASEAELATEVDAFTSAPVLDDVVTRLRLDADPEFGSRPPPKADATTAFGRAAQVAFRFLAGLRDFLRPYAFKDPQLDARSKLSKALSVYIKTASHTVSVQATARDPWKAADIANAVAAATVGRELSHRSEYNRLVEEWLGKRLTDLKDSVSQGEQRIEQLRAGIGRFDGQVGTILGEQLSQVSRGMLDVRAQLAAAQAKQDEVARLRSQPDGLARAGDVLASPTVQNLRSLEAKLSADIAAAQGKLGSQHPLLGSLRAQLAGAQGRLTAEVDRISRETSDRAGVLRSQLATLEQTRDDLQAQIERQGEPAARLRDLQRHVDDDRNTYSAFAIFRAKADGLPQFERPRLEILSPAAPAALPASPNRPAVLLGALFGTFGLGLLASVLRASFDQGLRSSEQVSALFGLETAALIPRAPKRRGRRDPATIALDIPESALAEAVRHLHASLTADRDDESPFRVLVCSALPYEGKTTTSLMLARQAAAVGEKTLLVCLDLRRAEPRRESDAEGYVFISQEAQSGLSTLTIRLHKRDSLRALYLPAFWQRLRDACEGYDFIVFDTPPVLPVSDAKMIARFADAQTTLLVVKWGATKVSAVEEALRQLRLAGSEGLRVALTQVDPRRQHAAYGYCDPAARADDGPQRRAGA